MFQVEDRERVQEHVLRMAHEDRRVTSGAVVGSLALSDGDRWSDLDLSFGVVDDVPVLRILDEWTVRLVDELRAIRLFDVPSGSSLYRVFLLPGCLQFDLSFTPATQFGALGPKFRLLFGAAVERPHTSPPPATELLGHAVHHALRARFCIERRRWWHAEYWISAVRDHALALACHRRGLPTAYGRGFDDLPTGLLEAFKPSLVGSFERTAMLHALECAVECLLAESKEAPELAAAVAPELRALILPDAE